MNQANDDAVDLHLSPGIKIVRNVILSFTDIKTLVQLCLRCCRNSNDILGCFVCRPDNKCATVILSRTKHLHRGGRRQRTRTNCQEELVIQPQQLPQTQRVIMRSCHAVGGEKTTFRKHCVKTHEQEEMKRHRM